MEQYVDDINDGVCDWSGDYSYKQNYKIVSHNPKDTQAEKNIRLVRRELAILIKSKISKREPSPVSRARKENNIKYGKGWRERGLVSNSKDQWLPLEQYPINV